MFTCRSNFAACVMANEKDLMVIGGFKENGNAGLRSVCKDVEILNTERNVWRPGPSLRGEAKSALASLWTINIQNSNEFMLFKVDLIIWDY